MTNISSDIVFRGEINYRGELSVDGNVEGKIISDGAISIGPGAVLKSDINVRQVVIKGQVHGNIKAELISIFSGGKVFGDFHCSQLQIERGGVHNGTSVMESD